MSAHQHPKVENTGVNLNSVAANPIKDLLSSLAVLPSAEQAFNLDPSALSQNGSAFLGILSDLQSNIKTTDNLAFACSPQSSIDKNTLPPLPSSLFKTPLRDRKRVRQAQEQESRLLNTGLNVKPRLVMVPTVPSDFRDQIKAEDAWSSKAELQTTLDRFQESKIYQALESPVTLDIAEWQESPHAGQPEPTANGESTSTSKRRLTVYLKVNMGLPTGLWGYICFGRRKRRYEGRYHNREQGNDLASAKRLKSDVAREKGNSVNEDNEGEAVIATRFHLFSEVEANKTQNDLSDFRWIQELCIHLNHLELSLAEMLHRLPAYSSIMQDSCCLCSSLLRRGVPPVRRAFLPAPDVSDIENETIAHNANASEDMATNGGLREGRATAQILGHADEGADNAKGQWVPFHSACL